MFSDVVAIQLAMEGRLDMLKTVFFPSEEKKPKGAIAERWKLFAHDHNLLFKSDK